MASCLAPVNREYFDQVYRRNEDPWNFESSEYEKEKYNATLRALPREKYGNALEIGCSIGVFTAKLAPRCERLLSIDIAAQAVKNARRRCHMLPQVSFEVMSVPEEYPPDQFDLTVVSEVGYYLSPDGLARLSERITEHARLGSHLALVHWLGEIPNYVLRGDDVHKHFLGLRTWNVISTSRSDLYRLDVLSRCDAAGDVT